MRKAGWCCGKGGGTSDRPGATFTTLSVLQLRAPVGAPTGKRALRRLIILPLRYSSRGPGRARCLHRLLKLCKITLDQSSQLRKHSLELLRGGGIVILLRLSWSRG